MTSELNTANIQDSKISQDDNNSDTYNVFNSSLNMQKLYNNIDKDKDKNKKEEEKKSIFTTSNNNNINIFGQNDNNKLEVKTSSTLFPGLNLTRAKTEIR